MPSKISHASASANRRANAFELWYAATVSVASHRSSKTSSSFVFCFYFFASRGGSESGWRGETREERANGAECQ